MYIFVDLPVWVMGDGDRVWLGVLLMVPKGGGSCLKKTPDSLMGEHEGRDDARWIGDRVEVIIGR